MGDLTFRRAQREDEPRLQLIRAQAFAPVFASFRSIMGEELYEIAQRRDDEAQGALLSSLLSAGPDTELYVAERGPEVVGFVSVLLNHERSIGEVGLNAVDPAQAGQGVGTAMYTFALDRMREVGMKAAVVSTGGDPSHAPARRAYEKAGFLVAVPSVWMCRTL